MAIFKRQAKEVDIIVPSSGRLSPRGSTALIPGKKVPLLMTKSMMNLMYQNSICTLQLARSLELCLMVVPMQA
jgi:NAD/NADP transhydrogenase alpha subunit